MAKTNQQPKPPNPFDDLGSDAPVKPTLSQDEIEAKVKTAREQSGYAGNESTPETKPAAIPEPPKGPTKAKAVTKKPSVKKTLVKRRKRAAPETVVFSGRLEPDTVNGLNSYADENNLPMREVVKLAYEALMDKQK